MNLRCTNKFLSAADWFLKFNLITIVADYHTVFFYNFCQLQIYSTEILAINPLRINVLSHLKKAE